MKYSEHDHQASLFAWSATQLRQWPCLSLLFAIPNGGHRHKLTAVRLKAEGVKAGVPDICLPVARGGYHGLFIEMKAGKNKATDSQAMWISALIEQGYYARICNGVDEAQATLEWYLEGAVENQI
jgi:hypothetical protein